MMPTHAMALLIVAAVLAATSHSAPLKMSPAGAREAALRERYRQEWLAEEPPPEAYVQAEDRERARLFGKPCHRADIGQGCHVLFPLHPEVGTLERDAPCAI